MKVAVLAYQYGMVNAGDFAITLGSIDVLLENYDKIIVISRYTEKQDEYHAAEEFLYSHYLKRVELIPGPFALDRTQKISLLISYFMGVKRLFSPKVLQSYIRIIKNADMLFVNGGNILRCNSLTDFIRIFALLYPAKVSNRCNIPVVFLPQSTTQINKIGYCAIKRILRKANTVFVREDISYMYLKNRIKGVNYVQSIDMAFFIKNRNEAKESFRRKYGKIFEVSNIPIAITLRKEKIGDIGQLNNNDIYKIKSKIIDLVNQMIKDKIPVIFVTQCQKDSEFTKKLFKEFQSDLVFYIEEYDPLILREIYRNVETLIGMRLHSLILATSVYTPVVGLFCKEWGNKNPGTMKKLKMPYVYITERIEWEEQILKAHDNKAELINIINEEKNKFYQYIKID